VSHSAELQNFQTFPRSGYNTVNDEKRQRRRKFFD
jgi:hypothetical protein